ncbi:MAG: CCA tRNA nucleotidyltransferase, partial [Alphaproteobacteria bacterium]
DMSEAQAREMLYGLGAENWRDRVLIAWARSGAGAAGMEADAWRALATLPERWTPPEFPLKGADLLAAGMAKGPRVGEALRTAEAHWIASGFSLSQEELLKAVQ